MCDFELNVFLDSGLHSDNEVLSAKVLWCIVRSFFSQVPYKTIKRNVITKVHAFWVITQVLLTSLSSLYLSFFSPSLSLTLSHTLSLPLPLFLSHSVFDTQIKGQYLEFLQIVFSASSSVSDREKVTPHFSICFSPAPLFYPQTSWSIKNWVPKNNDYSYA